MSSKTSSQARDNRANQLNPNNPAARDNRANQLNPNNVRYQGSKSILPTASNGSEKPKK